MLEPPDWPALYAEQQTKVLDQLAGLAAEQAAAPVAACPGWSVKDVMAHVSGLVAETLANVPLPRGSVEGTARQVSDRREWSLQQVCAEWESNATAFTTFGEADPAYVAALTSDLVVHFLDIAEALDLKVDTASQAVDTVASRYLQTLQRRVAEHLDVGLSATLIGVADFDAPNPQAGEQLGLSVTAHDFLRSVTARRTRFEVEALDWDGDPTAVLDGPWSQYGPLRD